VVEREDYLSKKGRKAFFFLSILVLDFFLSILVFLNSREFKTKIERKKKGSLEEKDER